MLPESCGGGGADLTTAAIVANLLGTYVAPIPFIEHVVAARLLASLDESNANLPLLATGEMIGSLALQPCMIRPTQLFLRYANYIIGLRGGDCSCRKYKRFSLRNMLTCLY